MWKCLLAAVCWLTLLGTTLGQDAQPSKLRQFLSTKCNKYSANAKIFDTLIVNTQDLKKYTKYAFSYLPNNKNHFCETERKHLSGRMHAVTNNLVGCLPTEEQFLPDVIQDVFDGFLNFICHNHGQNVDSFFSSQGETCRKNLAQSTEMEQCFQKIFPPLSREVITKQEVCDDLLVAEKCFNQLLEHQCPDFRAFQELNRDLFVQLRRACTDKAMPKKMSSSAAISASPILLIPVYLLSVAFYL